MVQTLREAGVATACLVTVYVGIAVTVALVARSPGVTPVVPTALTGALALSLLAGGAGVLHGSGLIEAFLEPLPREARLALRGAAGGLVALLAGGALVFMASLAWHVQDAARLYSSLGVDLAGSIELIGLCLAYAPVGVLWAMAYSVGPGFAVGTGTLVAPSGTTLGDLPAFPLLAALPGEGPAPALAMVGLVGSDPGRRGRRRPGRSSVAGRDRCDGWDRGRVRRTHRGARRTAHRDRAGRPHGRPHVDAGSAAAGRGALDRAVPRCRGGADRG